jgi:hypothetical protein
MCRCFFSIHPQHLFRAIKAQQDDDFTFSSQKVTSAASPLFFLQKPNPFYSWAPIAPGNAILRSRHVRVKENYNPLLPDVTQLLSRAEKKGLCATTNGSEFKMETD